MKTPTADDILQQIHGDCSMCANETLHSQDDPNFPYYHNDKGLYLIHFQSLLHVVNFFHGTEAQQEEARSMSKIEMYSRKQSKKNGKEAFITIKKPRYLFTSVNSEKAYLKAMNNTNQHS